MDGKNKYIVERRMLSDGVGRALQAFLDTDPYPEYRLVSFQMIDEGDYRLVWERMGEGIEAQDRDSLFQVLKKAYQKHVLDDPDVGWDELGEDLRMVLCNIMGHQDFNKWLDELSSDKSAAEM